MRSSGARTATAIERVPRIITPSMTAWPPYGRKGWADIVSFYIIGQGWATNAAPIAFETGPPARDPLARRAGAARLHTPERGCLPIRRWAPTGRPPRLWGRTGCRLQRE